MKLQSLSGKDKKLFLWKYEENGAYTSPLGVGHTAREVITHFINKRIDKDIEYFKAEFKSLQLGPAHPRIVLLEYAKKVYEDTGRKKKRYFTEFPVELNNGEMVVISTQWGATNTPEQQWENFKNKMAKHGYFIKSCDELKK